MSKKRNKKPAVKKPFNWKKNSKWIALLAVLVIVTGYFYVAGENASRLEHDLSVVGNGKPTVVQIHDTGCQLCRRLKATVDSVKPEYQDNIQFRTANINTEKGAAFAEKHRVPHVTLLIFNKNGRLTNTLRGVQSRENVISALDNIR